MPRVVPPCIDVRNDVERNLDAAIREIHETLGDELRGYVLLAYGADLSDPMTAMVTTIIPSELPDYVADVIEARLFNDGDFAENDNGN